jgi:hypothetical protein
VPHRIVSLTRGTAASLARMELLLDPSPHPVRTRSFRRSTKFSHVSMQPPVSASHGTILVDKLCSLHATILNVIKSYSTLPGHNPSHFDSLQTFKRRTEALWWRVRDDKLNPDPPKGFCRAPSPSSLIAESCSPSDQERMVAELEAQWKKSAVVSAWFGAPLNVGKPSGRKRSGLVTTRRGWRSRDDRGGTTPQ